MIRRFFWFVIGALTGAWLLNYLRVKARTMVEQATPSPLRRFTGTRQAPVASTPEPNSARALGRTIADARHGFRGRVSTFVEDVRLAAAEREAELREELELDEPMA